MKIEVNDVHLLYVLIKDQESAVCISDSSDVIAVNEKDPWELPEFTHNTIPWRGIRNIVSVID